jgi:hypothetical protein
MPTSGSSPPSRAESDLSAARAAAGPQNRCLSHAPCDQTDAGRTHVPPFWYDGTERPIHRPTDPEDQQDYDSGKKKCHTVKNLLIIDETCHIYCLRDTVEGKEHDKSLAELAGYTLPRQSHLYQDWGFQGFMLNRITMIQPRKKPRGGELTPLENAHNRVISSVGIRVITQPGSKKEPMGERAFWMA